MAGHTDVVRQIHAEAGGIYDGVALPGRVSRIHGANVRRAWPVTVFTTNGHLSKRWGFEASIGCDDWPGAATVTGEATGKDGSVATSISKLVPTGRPPVCS